jgi:hypothetical protein
MGHLSRYRPTPEVRIFVTYGTPTFAGYIFYLISFYILSIAAQTG